MNKLEQLRKRIIELNHPGKRVVWSSFGDDAKICSLPMVLTALMEAGLCFHVEHHTIIPSDKVGININPNQSGTGIDYFDWLLRVDGQDAVLEDQSEETQQKLLDTLT